MWYGKSIQCRCVNNAREYIERVDVHEEAGVGGVRRTGAGDVDLLDMIRLRTIALQL